jgi:hypothetical protein
VPNAARTRHWTKVPADLTVLNADYFTVPDEGLKRLNSVLTFVGGRIVHDAGELNVHDR